MPRRTDRRALADLLPPGAVLLGAPSATRDDVIRSVGGLLVGSGAVDSSYVSAMIERENSVSTFVGEGVALPHATFAAEGSVHRDAIAVLTLADPVDWDGDEVRVIVGLCALGRGHIGILSRLASVLLDPTAVSGLADAGDEAEVRRLLTPAAAGSADG